MKKMGLFWFAAALLGAALIFGGCPTEAETETKYVAGEMIYLDVVVSTIGDLEDALAEETGDLAIGLDAPSDDSTITVGADGLLIRPGKVVYILNGTTLATATDKDLTVEGIVYVGVGATLDVSAGNVIVTSGGISVLPAKSIAAINSAGPGTLKVSASARVNDGADDPATALGTDKGKVWIGGTLKYSANTDVDTVTKIETALGYVGDGGELEVVGTNTSLKPSDVAAISLGAKKLTIQADGADTATTSISIPAGLFLTTDVAFSELASVTVAEGGGFYATSTSGAFTAAGIGLTANGEFYAASTLTFKDNSSVGANGSVTLVAGATFGDGIKLSVVDGSHVYFGATNNVVFPAAAEITGITDEALTIGNITVLADGILAVEGGTLVLAADAVLTLKPGAVIWGEVKAGATTIDGGGPPDDVGGWRAADTEVATVIKAGGSGATTTATITGGVLSGFNGSVITQAAETGNELTIEDDTVVNLGAGGRLVLTTTSSLAGKISGAGSIVAGATTITGAWEATGTGDGTLTIDSAAAGATITATSDATGLKASTAGATITQAAGSGNTLTIATGTTIALGGDGAIELKHGASATDGGKITLAKGTSSKITTNNTAGGSNTTAIDDVATAHVTLDSATTSNKLVSITAKNEDGGCTIAVSSTSDDVTIDKDTVVSS
jgi:hypothetical protein